MKEFIVENGLWELFPAAKIGVLVITDMDNHYKDKVQLENMLAEAQAHSQKYLTNPTFSENTVIKIWRDAFQKFKTKKGARSSVEALLKRGASGNGVGNINPLVDLYNICSLNYALPNGSEDLDKIVGNILLTKATGEESFVTLGSQKSEPPYPEEIVYKDDEGAICRCWNWREAERTMITEDTTNAFLCIETLDPQREEDFHKALVFLENQITQMLGGKCQKFILDIANPKISF